MDRDERIEKKLDNMTDDLTDIKVILAKQHVVLVEHESRSTKLEAIVLPLQQKVNMVEGVLKFIGGLGILAGLVEAIYHMIKG